MNRPQLTTAQLIATNALQAHARYLARARRARTSGDHGAAARYLTSAALRRRIVAALRSV